MGSGARGQLSLFLCFSSLRDGVTPRGRHRRHWQAVLFGTFGLDRRDDMDITDLDGDLQYPMI